MKSRLRYLGFIVILALGFALVLPGFTPSARAASEDVAMFYDELSQQGQWVDYEKYGPVWHPSNVDEDWRPYTNGRWVPTNDGYVFETQEPWGWATYHYGNWMPTQGYGWVWVPGRTWYPSTVEWRTSPETEAVDTSYVGWAPIPPPDYVPPPAYAPAQYYPGAPVTDLLTTPFWIFARAASFLLGFGQPYAPGYSYYGCGCLAPPAFVPTFFPLTAFVPNYYTPGYLGFAGLGYGAYNWGPPVPYLARYTNINQTVIINNLNINTVNITKINNVVVSHHLLDKHGYLKQITPPNLVQGKPLPPSHPVKNIKLAQASLGKPNIVPLPKNVPHVTAQIPKVQPLAATPGKVPGALLPTKSTMPLTPNMTQQIQKLPPQQQVVPTKATPITPTVTPKPVTPTVTPKPVTPTVTPKPVTPTVTPKPVTPTVTPKPVTPTVTPKPVTPTVTPKPVTPTVTPKPVTPKPVTPTVTPKPVTPRPVTPTVTPRPVTPRPVTPTVTPRPVTPKPVTPPTPRVTTPPPAPKAPPPAKAPAPPPAKKPPEVVK